MKTLLIVGMAGAAAMLLLPKSAPNDTGEDDGSNTLLEDANSMIDTVTQDSSSGSDANVAAFLQTLRVSEGTAGDRGYQTECGYTYFDDYSVHPAVAGWHGLPLSDAMCTAAGYGAGCVSTAAGAYQINKPTWNRISAKLGLSDFSPASQDAAAIGLIDEKGALADVRNGNFASAIGKVKRVWASLPGAGYSQGEHSLATLQAAYLNAGGALA
jgi:muramidase (phage lysozyme)